MSVVCDISKTKTSDVSVAPADDMAGSSALGITISPNGYGDDEDDESAFTFKMEEGHRQKINDTTYVCEKPFSFRFTQQHPFAIATMRKSRSQKLKSKIGIVYSGFTRCPSFHVIEDNIEQQKASAVQILRKAAKEIARDPENADVSVSLTITTQKKQPTAPKAKKQKKEDDVEEDEDEDDA